MNTPVMAALITGVFGAIVAPLFTQIVIPFLIKKIFGKPVADDPQQVNPPRPRVKRKSKLRTLTLVSAVVGGAAGVYIGFGMISPVINAPCSLFAPTKVSITSPLPGSAEPRLVAVQGTACNIPSGQELWLLVVPEGATGYYPQNGPIKVANDGTWGSSAYIGLDGDVDLGRGFRIFTALADPEGSKVVRRYFTQSPSEFKSIEPLPQSIQLMSHVRVVRK